MKKFILYYLGFFLLSFAWWVNKYFGKINIDQIWSTLIFGAEGVLTVDPIYLIRFLKCCIVLPFALSIILMLLERFYYFRGFKHLPSILLMAGVFYVSYQCNLIHFLKSIGKNSDYFAENYVDPRHIDFKIKHPKSLILIYVESLENTYSDESIFGKDLLAPLTALKKDNIAFDHYEQMPGTGWTIAGIIATQCGIPLKMFTIFGENKQHQMLNSFLPNAYCLSDILAKAGYLNIYMNGSSLDFAGKRVFLKDHHYEEVYGKEEWLANHTLEKNAPTGWGGLADDQLFFEAKKKVGTLIQKDQLFNLTLLTINTHGPSGYLNEDCIHRKKQGFDGIVECTADQVADFVHYAKEHGWLQKVNIVILGDHLSMKNPLSNQLASSQSRSIFNLIITNQSITKNTNEIVHFDLFPTIVELLGFSHQNNRLGLGYSAISRTDSAPSSRIATMQLELNNYSKFYNQLWQA